MVDVSRLTRLALVVVLVAIACVFAAYLSIVLVEAATKLLAAVRQH